MSVTKYEDETVREIYHLAWHSDMKQAAIAERFGVSPSHVSFIKTGRKQARITGHNGGVNKP